METTLKVQEYDYVDFSSVSPIIRGLVLCGICAEPLIDPVRFACKHTYCRTCFFKFLGNHRDTAPCPECTTPLKYEDRIMGEDTTLERVLEQLEVYCNNKEHPGNVNNNKY